METVINRNPVIHEILWTAKIDVLFYALEKPSLNLNIRNYLGLTLLERSIGSHDTQRTVKLIQCGVNLGGITKSVFKIATKNNNLDMVKLLMDHVDKSNLEYYLTFEIPFDHDYLVSIINDNDYFSPVKKTLLIRKVAENLACKLINNTV
jgi:hypothetical protein